MRPSTLLLALVGLTTAAPLTSTTTTQHQPRSAQQCPSSPTDLTNNFKLAAYATSDPDAQPTFLALARPNTINPYPNRYLLAATTSFASATPFTYDARARRLRASAALNAKADADWGFHSADLRDGEQLFLAADDGTAPPESAIAPVRDGGCESGADFALGDGREGDGAWWLCGNPVVPDGALQLYYAGRSREVPPQCERVVLRPRTSHWGYVPSE